jgi:lysophospholipase L1-like esterase
MLAPLCLNPSIVAALLLLLTKEKLEKTEASCYKFYTALGDSIAYGLGAPNRYGYAYMFRDFLKSRCPNVKLRNISSPGITSSSLLLKLRLSSRARFAVKNAGLITISIGGNNLLKGVSRNYTTLNPAIAQEGIKRFAKDWPLILNCIRNDIKSTAPILAMTLYNPYRYDDPLYPTADYFIREINSIIKDIAFQNTYGYIVVDVHEYFESNPSKDWVRLYESRRNPHPNLEGHKQIFFLHKNIVEP